MLGDLPEYGVPPVYRPPKKELADFETAHIPNVSDEKKNCVVCYKETKKALNVVTYCSAPQCQVFLHISKTKNCFEIWHTNKYDKN